MSEEQLKKAPEPYGAGACSFNRREKLRLRISFSSSFALYPSIFQQDHCGCEQWKACKNQCFGQTHRQSPHKLSLKASLGLR
jgi:hypothetical protein